MKTFIGIILLMLMTFAGADVYKWIAPDGSVIYTDRPLNGAVRVPVPAWHPPPPPPAAPAFLLPAARPKVRTQTGYEHITVEKPSAGQYMREGGEGIEVVVRVTPRLDVKKGHRVQVLLNGEARGSASSSTTQRIMNIDRGPHSIAAQVVGSDGRVLIQSKPVNIFYQRPSHAFTARGFIPTDRHPVRAAPRAPSMPKFPRALNVPPIRSALIPPPPQPPPISRSPITQ